jgi:hypothetical protein
MEAQYPGQPMPQENFFSGYQRQAQFENAEQNNYINQLLAKQKYDQDQQKFPHDVADLQSQTSARLAGIPGIMDSNRIKNVEADVAEGSRQQQVEAKRMKIATEISDDKLKQAENHIGQRIATLPMGSPEHQQAVKQWENLGKIREIKMKLDAEKAMVAMREGGATERNQANINAGKFDPKATLSLEVKIDTEGDPVKKYTLLLDAAQQARQSGDNEKAENYMARAAYIKNIADAKIAADAKPGSVDISKTTKGKVATNPRKDIAPPSTPTPTATPAAKPQFSGKRVTVMKDGKSFSLPEEQVEAAKAQGYTLK